MFPYHSEASHTLGFLSKKHVNFGQGLEFFVSLAKEIEAHTSEIEEKHKKNKKH